MMHFVLDVMDRIVVKTLRLVNIYLCNQASVDASALELCCRRFEPALQPLLFIRTVQLALYQVNLSSSLNATFNNGQFPAESYG